MGIQVDFKTELRVGLGIDLGVGLGIGLRASQVLVRGLRLGLGVAW